MANESVNTKPLRTPRARLSFPYLFEKAKYDDGKEKYGCVLLLDATAQASAEFAALKAAATACVQKQWPNGVPPGLISPFKRGDDKNAKRMSLGKPPLDGYAGCIILSPTSMQRPQIVDRQLNIVNDPSKVYPGMYVFATVSPYAYNVKGNVGVSFGLRNVQLIADGEPLGGRSNAADDFEALDPETSAENPAALF